MLITPKNQKCRALLFHSVNSNNENGLSHISVEKFESFLIELNDSDITSCTISELESYKNSKAIALVFDDGFEDFYHNALPLLKKHGHNATVYPVAKSIDHNFSWDLYSNRPQLSSEQIKELADNDIEIGSHTYSHPDLTRLSDQNLEMELTKSKVTLEKIIGKKIKSISFPFGSWNERVWDLAKEAGYSSASAYRKHNKAQNGIIPVQGVYSFDTVETMLQKCGVNKLSKMTSVKSFLMPHFAKGTALWNFRKDYNLLPK